MAQNNRSVYAPGYDLFKLIVAVILTIILILLLLIESRARYAGLSLTSAASFMTERAALPTMTLQPPVAFTSTASIEMISTQTPVMESTPTQLAILEPTPAETIPTQQPPPTEVAAVETVPASDPNECPTNPTRIQAQDTVLVKDWLNFRTGPGLHYEIQRTNRPGIQMEVIGGPVCTIKDGNPPRAYLWWNVRMETGQEGWSAEAPLNFPNYFLEPTE